MINLYNLDNLDFNPADQYADYIYCDPIYEDLNFHTWMYKYWASLKKGGVFVVQTDHHSVFEMGSYMKELPNSNFINHLVVYGEWGNHPKNKFHQCFDDILIFSKGLNYKFYPERIQVPKKTLTAGLNPSGRTTKQATAWVDDCVLTTTSKERVRTADNHLIRWQKSQKLFDRITGSMTDEGDMVFDIFAGSGSLGVWCKNNKRQYIGLENNPEVYALAHKRICDIL
jgi:site-specific DNA-methyltransferase (adenine-specific)